MIVDMYITLMSVILAGIMNMLFTKTKFYSKYRYPIDGGKKIKDGQYIFGENKTWIGFFSMIFFNILAQIIWGFLCLNIDFLKGKNYIYTSVENNFFNNAIIGAVLGLAYVVFELPNSFIKRRLKIKPGKTAKGIKGMIFFLIDQIDSIIGVTLVLCIWYKMTAFQFLLFVFLGAITHIVINLFLYYIKIRKNI